MINGLGKVVFFGAHTDDEMVCAGTLHRLSRQGSEVHVVTFAPAATAEDRRGTGASVLLVEPEWQRALDLLGVKPNNRVFTGLTPSSDFQRWRQVICQIIFDYCEKHRPDAVITLSPEDENTAHAVVGVESERVLRGRVPLALRCHFPWNYGIGRPNVFVKLDQIDLEVKERVIDAYATQAFRYRYREMLLSYARADGLSVKVEPAAEKFELLRAVV